MKKSMLNSKIKFLKNQLVHKSAMSDGIPPGRQFLKSTEMGYPIQQNLI